MIERFSTFPTLKISLPLTPASANSFRICKLSSTVLFSLESINFCASSFSTLAYVIVGKNIVTIQMLKIADKNLFFIIKVPLPFNFSKPIL